MPLPRLLLIALAGALLVLVPTGCEFPGPAVTVAFTSHTDGQVIRGNRTITVTGEYTGTAATAVTLLLNRVSVHVSLGGSNTFSAQVTLADCGNTLEARVTNSGSSTATMHLMYEPPYPALCFFDGEAAANVIGQQDFTTSLGQSGNAYLNGPAGAPALVGGYLYIPDTGNNRIVGFTSVPAYDGAPFSILLGQTDYMSNTASPVTNGSTLDSPSGVADAGGDLAVADTGHNRVLLYAGAPTNLNEAALVAVGQTSLYASTNTTCDDIHMDGPTAATVTAGGKLIVADAGHNRLLIWNSVPTQSGVAANLVLGQASFGSCGTNSGGRSGATLADPTDVWTDGTRLVVADSGNNRVLVWTSFPTTNGQAANLVLGQTTMTSGAAGAGPSGLSDPRSVASYDKQLFVADASNHRVMIWNETPTTDGASADAVLGQVDFTGTTANRGGDVGAGTLADPRGVRAFDGMLMVADTGNARELIYKP